MEKVQNAVDFIIKSLVDDPANVKITCEKHDKNVDCKVVVPESEIGKVIGRNGKIANSIRMVARTIGKKDNLRVNIKIDKE